VTEALGYLERPTVGRLDVFAYENDPRIALHVAAQCFPNDTDRALAAGKTGRCPPRLVCDRDVLVPFHELRIRKLLRFGHGAIDAGSRPVSHFGCLCRM